MASTAEEYSIIKFPAVHIIIIMPLFRHRSIFQWHQQHRLHLMILVRHPIVQVISCDRYYLYVDDGVLVESVTMPNCEQSTTNSSSRPN